VSGAEIFGQAVLGWLLADLLSGIVHWWQDRVPSTNMPVLGKWLIEPSRLHHREPLVFAQGSFWDRSFAMMVAALAVSLVWWLVAGASVLWFFCTLGGMVVTEVHRLAHEPRKAGTVLLTMQQIGIIQSPKHHAGHHRPPMDRRYCILTDWLNPALDQLRVWERFENLLDRLHIPVSRGTR
jgi:hypothetical protein